MQNLKPQIKAFLDAKKGQSHGHRTWLGRMTKAESTFYFGVDFGASLIRISEKDSLIQVVRRSSAGSIIEKNAHYKSVAYFNAVKPEASRYETSGKARSAILQLMAS